jgi:hypothetical protein
MSKSGAIDFTGIFEALDTPSNVIAELSEALSEIMAVTPTGLSRSVRSSDKSTEGGGGAVNSSLVSACRR